MSVFLVYLFLSLSICMSAELWSQGLLIKRDGIDSDYHSLIVQCTLSLVLRTQCVVLVGHTTSGVSCHYATLLPHT